MKALSNQLEETRSTKKEAALISKKIAEFKEIASQISSESDNSDEIKKKLKDAQDQIDVLNNKFKENKAFSLNVLEDKNGILYKLSQTSWLKSAVLPGWGQWTNAEKETSESKKKSDYQKGNYFMIGTVVSAIAYFNVIFMQKWLIRNIKMQELPVRLMLHTLRLKVILRWQRLVLLLQGFFGGGVFMMPTDLMFLLLLCQLEIA